MTSDQNTPRERKPRAIVMLSLGDRPWAEAAAATFQNYATACGADFWLERKAPRAEELPFPELDPERGRRAKLAYASKIFFAWKYLSKHGYDRVLFVDDSCCVRPGAPDLFALVPAGRCGFTGTSRQHAQQSFDAIEEYVSARNLPSPEYRGSDYANGGVILYDRRAVNALSPERICAAAELLYARYPQQTLLYYLFKNGGVRLHKMPKSFNTIPAISLPTAERFRIKDIQPHLSDEIFIYHITSGYRHRDVLVRQLSELFLASGNRPTTTNG